MALASAGPGQAWTTGTEGCTPGYWKNHTDSWSMTSYTTSQTVDSVFTGADPSLGSQTLLDALSFQGGDDLVGKQEILLRAAVAALLNSSAGLDYGVQPHAIIKAVNGRLAKGNLDGIVNLASKLDTRNNQGSCPLS